MSTGSRTRRISRLLAELREVPTPSGDSTTLMAREALVAACELIGRSWCGSTMGYHSRVYYKDLQPPPVGAHFDIQWGLTWHPDNSTKGEWLELPFEVVSRAIEVAAGNPDCTGLESTFHAELAFWESQRHVARSVLSKLLKLVEDPAVADALDQVVKQRALTRSEIVLALLGRERAATLDARASSEGPCVPPHVAFLARLAQFTAPSSLRAQLGRVATQVVAHLESSHGRPAP